MPTAPVMRALELHASGSSAKALTAGRRPPGALRIGRPGSPATAQGGIPGRREAVWIYHPPLDRHAGFEQPAVQARVRPPTDAIRRVVRHALPDADVTDLDELLIGRACFGVALELLRDAARDREEKHGDQGKAVHAVAHGSG